MKLRVLAPLVLLGLFAVGCAPPAGPQLTRSIIVSGQGSVVWDIAFLDSDTFFFTLRSGAINVKDGANAPATLGTPPDSAPQGEGGVMGLAVDPSYSSNRLIYVCYMTATDVRVASFQVKTDLTGFDAGPTPIVTGIQRNTTSSPGRHSGCRIRFKPGTDELFIGTGDAANGTNPQNTSSLNGKILRVQRDGSPYPGNPGYADNRIYNIGHRNIQGLAFRTDGSNFPFNAEHGTFRDDEVNKVVAGANYGWDPVPGYDESTPMTDLNKFPSARKASWSSGNPTVAPSGMTFLSGSQWKGWNGALAVAILKTPDVGCRLRIMFLNQSGTSVTGFVDTLTRQQQRLRTAVQGPDGNLYIGTDSGEIWKLVPS